MSDASTYHYDDACELGHHYDYLLPAILDILERQPKRTVFDLGCGNGTLAAYLTEQGWNVIGCDPSAQGIANANLAYPNIRLEQASAYDPLHLRFGTFPIVISIEVIEHIYSPRVYAKTLFNLMEPNGTAIISTPYHGYLKNLVLAITGKMDDHFTALWDHGHIKFWSERTLSALLKETGFSNISIQRVGRIRALSKSMIAVAKRPSI